MRNRGWGRVDRFHGGPVTHPAADSARDNAQRQTSEQPRSSAHADPGQQSVGHDRSPTMRVREYPDNLGQEKLCEILRGHSQAADLSRASRIPHFGGFRDVNHGMSLHFASSWLLIG